LTIYCYKWLLLTVGNCPLVTMCDNTVLAFYENKCNYFLSFQADLIQGTCIILTNTTNFGNFMKIIQNLAKSKIINLQLVQSWFPFDANFPFIIISSSGFPKCSYVLISSFLSLYILIFLISYNYITMSITQ